MVTRDEVLKHRTDLYNRFMITSRESDIVAELIQGQTNRQIAEVFFIEEKTVKFHLTNVYKKLGVVSRLEAVVKVDSYIRSLLPKPSWEKSPERHPDGTPKKMHSLLDTKAG